MAKLIVVDPDLDEEDDYEFEKESACLYLEDDCDFPGPGKQTSYGFSTGQIEEVSRLKRALAQRIRKDIMKLLDENAGQPCENEFIIMHCDSYTPTETDFYLPSEIGLTAFSLNHGILDVYGTLIDPVSIPLGYLCDVRQVADSHGIPMPNFSVKCQDYGKVLKEVTEFLALHPTYKQTVPMVFCLREEMPAIHQCLTWLSEKSGVEIPAMNLRPLSFLFYQLARIGSRRLEEEREIRAALSFDNLWEELLPKVDVSHAVPSIVNEASKAGPSGVDEDPRVFIFERDATAYLKSLNKAFDSELGCHHHMTNAAGIIHCSLNIVTRYAWNILEAVAGYWRIVPKEGSHYPWSDKLGEMERRRSWLEIVWGKKGFKDLPGFDDSYFDIHKELEQEFKNNISEFTDSDDEFF